MKKIVKNYSLEILLSALLVNYLSNIINQSDNLIFFYLKNIHFLLSTFFSIYFYFILSNYIKKSLKLNSRILSITYFFSSFFLIELIFFPVINLTGFRNLYLIIIISWLLIITLSSKSIKIFLHIVITYLSLSFFNYYYFEKLKSINWYVEWSNDVPSQWFELANLISSKGLFQAYTNNLIKGQGLFINNTQTIIFKLNFPLQDFQFIRVNSIIILFFSYLLFLDLKVSRNRQIIIALVFSIFVLNSEWLSYLFIDSLMLEGLASLFFGVYVYKSGDYMKTNLNFNSLVFYFFFSSVLFSKEFISTLTLVYLLYLLFIKKNQNVIVVFVIYSLERFYRKLYVPPENGASLLDGRSLTDLFFDLINLRNLDFNVLINILIEFTRDRIALVIFIYFIFVNLYSIKSKNGSIETVIFILILLNIVFIFIIYISWWNNIEVQSSYRYFLNCLHLIMISIALKAKSLNTE
tara:strand:+ start:46 stop:1440 length:1395 start_codon:yes stop_codon:yes gene_type:complete